jgi:hypothetical protein
MRLLLVEPRPLGRGDLAGPLAPFPRKNTRNRGPDHLTSVGGTMGLSGA